jgi:hypothetical protein
VSGRPKPLSDFRRGHFDMAATRRKPTIRASNLSSGHFKRRCRNSLLISDLIIGYSKLDAALPAGTY